MTLLFVTLIGLGTLSLAGELTGKVSWTVRKIGEAQPEDWTGLIDKVHLHKTTFSILGEVAVLSNIQKPKQSQKKMKKQKEYVAIKRTR